MEMFRAAAAFLAGVVIMGLVHFSGWLDNVPHWWAHQSAIGAHAFGDDANEHARYTVRAVYQPSQDSDSDCPPQYEFHTRTNRQVVFSTNEGDEDSYDSSSDPNGAVSMQPSNGGAQPGNSAQDNDQQYGNGQDNGRYGRDADYSGDQYYDEYPGGSSSQSSDCSSVVVQIFVDRKNKK
jgi:hypothetical protein